MTLFIACLLIYQGEFSWYWYPAACVIYAASKFYEHHRFNKALYWLEDRHEKLRKDIVGKFEEENG